MHSWPIHYASWKELEGNSNVTSSVQYFTNKARDILNGKQQEGRKSKLVSHVSRVWSPLLSEDRTTSKNFHVWLLHDIEHLKNQFSFPPGLLIGDNNCTHDILANEFIQHLECVGIFAWWLTNLKVIGTNGLEWVAKKTCWSLRNHHCREIAHLQHNARIRNYALDSMRVSELAIS